MLDGKLSRAAALLAWISALSSHTTIATSQQSVCGQALENCVVPMFGLSQADSKERIELDELFAKLKASANNDLQMFLNDRLATAIREISIKADDSKMQFWVMIINPTTTKQTETFYVGRANAFQTSIANNVRDLNCRLKKDGCTQFERQAFDKIWTGLKDTGKLIGKFDVPVEPRSIAVHGFSVGSGEGFSSDDYPIALLRRTAPEHMALDIQDVLRIGLVHDDGRTTDLGEAKRVGDDCAVFATYVGEEFEDNDSNNNDNLFLTNTPNRVACFKWSVTASKSCKDAFFYYRARTKHLGDVTSELTMDANTETKCGSSSSRFWTEKDN
jgi:hypothetical protein